MNLIRIEKLNDALSWVKKTAIWCCWELSGIRFLWEKIYPPLVNNSSSYRPPVTITLWVMATYIALFGIASSRYENKVDIIENRANSIFSQLSTSTYKKALSRIARIQHMHCPRQPNLLWPPSVFFSLIVNDRYTPMVILLKNTLEDWKMELSNCDLNLANLKGADLGGANLKGTKLLGANLERAFLRKANLEGANLEKANLEEAYLIDANLEGANLGESNLKKADLRGANLKEANLSRNAYEMEFGVNLKYLGEIYLDRGKYKGAKYKGANLEGANLEGANLEGANLEGANLEGANLEGANLEGANLEGANLEGANLEGANLEGANL